MNSKPLSLPTALSVSFVTYFPSAFRLIALGSESSMSVTAASALSPHPAMEYGAIPASRRVVLYHSVPFAGRSAVIVIILADGRMDRISSVGAEDEDAELNEATTDGTQDDAERERTD